jgi:pentatricopeptide repeat protein
LVILARIFSASAGRNNQLRFFVISNQPAAGLDLLERSILGQPIAGAPGAPPRFLKLPPAAVCNKVLHSAAQSRDAALVSKAADLADALALHSVGVEGRTLRALAGALGRQGAVGRALPLLDRWLAGQAEALEDDEAAAQEPLHLLTALVEAAARAEDAPSVLATLARFAAVGLNPSTPSMTSLLQCFMRLGHVDTAHAMVAWMRRNGLRPSAFTYTALLALPRDGGSPAAAKAVLAKVRAH